MKNYKKLSALLTAAAMLVGFAACSVKEKELVVPEPEVTVRVEVLSGPTGFGMLELIDKNSEGTALGSYEFTVAGAPAETISKIISGDVDIAAVPTNSAALLYNKTEGEVKMLALNTLGVLYIVENGQAINSVNDLRGKTIYATGLGATPEYVLSYLLEKSGLEEGVDVLTEYRAEHAEVAALLADGTAQIAMLPQPFVTSAMKQNPDLRTALDLSSLWEESAEGADRLTMGCVVVRKEFADKYPAAVEEFMREYKASVEFVTAPVNAAQVGTLSEKYGMLPAPIATAALPYCNIVYVDGAEMKDAAEGFLKVLHGYEPSAVGGKLPENDFYYETPKE